MSVIIRLQNLPLTAISIDIRNFFRGLSIPDGGVHIVGGSEGDAFIAFSTDEDARQAMQLTGQKLKDSPVRLLLSSRNEMFKVIEQARMGQAPPSQNVSARSNNSPSSPTTGQVSAPTTLSQTNPNNFSSPGMLGLGLGLGGANNFLHPAQGLQQQQQALQQHQNAGLQGMAHHGQGLQQGQGMHPHTNAQGLQNHGNQEMQNQSHGIHLPTIGNNPPPGFPAAISGNNHHNNMLGSNDGSNVSSSGNTNPFGMSNSITAAMGMSYPNILQNAGNGLQGLNPAAMMGMGMPPPMLGLNPQLAAQFQQQGPRGMNNGLNLNGNNANTMHMPPNLGGSPMTGNLPPRMNTFPNMNPNNMNTNWGAGIMGNSPPPFRPSGLNMTRPPLSTGGGSKDNKGGLMGNGPNNGPMRQNVHPMKPDLNRDLRKSRSSSRERRDGMTRRRRSRSRDRDRNERRRRSSRSRSRSRSPKGRLPARRDSRDKDDRRGSRGDSSPEKGRGGRRDSRDSVDPPPNAYNMTEEEYPAIKLSGISNDASFREIKDFLRVEIMGGGDGTVRLYDENVAYVKLEKPSDYPRAYRSNGRTIRNTVVLMEGISIERWVNEYKMNKSRMERDIDRDREKDRIRDRDDRSSDRGRPEKPERGGERERPERGARPSRFNTAAQSSYIVIRNLPPTITTRDVSSRLLKDAAMLDMVVSAGPPSNGRHTAVAFVKLDSPQAAKQTIDNIFKSNDGVNLVVETSNMEDFNRAKNRTTVSSPNTDQKSLGDAKSIFDLESGLDDESCSVVLKGAPPNVSERDVFDFFSDIGLVPMNVKVMYDPHGTCNGQIICEFPDPHQARRATTKDGMLFGRGHVKVELIPSGRKRAADSSMHMKGPRPALLGPRPINPRFGIPPGPNPFIQALQVANGPRTPGARGRGLHPSRFSSRNDFGSSSNGSSVDRDDRAGAGRGRGIATRIVSVADDAVGNSQGPTFGKPGCILALENVPYKASMDDILNHLSSILKLEISREKIIRRFDDSEKPTGDARVAFDTPLEALLAHASLSGTKMWNRPITYTIL